MEINMFNGEREIEFEDDVEEALAICEIMDKYDCDMDVAELMLGDEEDD
jgi:hypothetical protein